MKLIEFKEFNREEISKEINKKKVAITTIISVISVIIFIFVMLYIYNGNFRRWADNHILMKTVTEGTLSYIDIDKNENKSILTYDKYVALVSVNKLEIFNSSARQIATINVNLNNPIYNSNGKYLVVGDKGKQKVYLISGTKIVWQTEIEGNVSRVSVNENGYVSVVCMGNTYKSIVSTYNPSGKQLFRTHIPTNTVVDSAISSDNKYLSVAEIDTSKTTIESTIKTISIKDATESSENAIVSNYKIPSNSLIVNIKYQGSKNLICMCNDTIYTLSDGEIKTLMNFEEENKKISFAGINLSNTIYEIEEIAEKNANQNSNVLLLNSQTKKQYSYKIDGIAKETASSYDNIAINLGNKVYFINSRGWLKKEYIANQEIKEIIISDRIAAIVFRDKIEILIL